MCGIAAIFAHGADAPPVDMAALGRMHDRMRARGPDGEGVWHTDNGRLGLAHRRLSIIDLSAGGAQPMTTADGRLTITYNGEIYNYRALRRELAEAGVAFHGDSDTEVILELYRREGAGVVERLRGMYAFALWDADRRGLLLARDPYGIKPLYYADDGKTLRIASQVKALLAGGGIDTAPEPAGHAGFFLLGYVPEPATLYRGIKALPSGHTMWVDGEGAEAPRAFFDLGETLRAAGETDEEDPEALRAALTDAVAHHLVADVPVGLFLSSGLDSATLTALATEQVATPPRTITLGFEEYRGTPADEVPLAERIAALYGTEHRTVWVEQAAFEAERERLLDAMDQPTIDGTNVYFVSKVAAEAGLKVAISGLGGDELFGGYDSFRQIPPLVRALGPLRHAPAIGRAFRRLALPAATRLASPKYAGVLEYGATYPGAYLLRRSLYMPWELADVLDPDLARQGWRAIEPMLRDEGAAADLATPGARITVLESEWYMRNQLLRDSDWAGMAHSLEIRVPLVDVTLLRRLAPLLAGRRAPGKRAMALTPRTPLPAVVLDRRKTGFRVPIQQWLAPPASGARPERGYRGWLRTIHAAQWPG